MQPPDPARIHLTHTSHLLSVVSLAVTAIHSHSPTSNPTFSSAMSSAASSAAAGEIRAALTSLHSAIQGVMKAKGLTRQPLLVAVSKTKPVEAILAAYNSGAQPAQRHFGENYVQELLDKAGSRELDQDPTSAEHVRWHFIGHLQTNKCKQIARIPNLAMVESVDSVRLANELNKACEAAGRPSRLPVLIQVNTSGEASKYGCAPEDAVSLFGHVLHKCPRLHARGLMTIGRLADTPQPDCFDTLVRCKAQILDAFNGARAEAASADASASSSSSELLIDPDSFELSMGMSGDWKEALERGATILRIGSTIFGARQYPQKEAAQQPAATATAESKEQQSELKS